MYKFKIGDRVRIVDVSICDTEFEIKIGDKATVLDISDIPYLRMDKYGKKLYACDGLCEKGYGKAMQENKLELIKEDNMNLKDLLVPGETVVECGNGEKRFITKDDDGDIFYSSATGFDRISSLDEDLKDKEFPHWDIVKIFKIKQMVAINNLFKNDGSLTQIWPKPTKKYTFKNIEMELTEEERKEFIKELEG